MQGERSSIGGDDRGLGHLAEPQYPHLVVLLGEIRKEFAKQLEQVIPDDDGYAAWIYTGGALHGLANSTDFFLSIEGARERLERWRERYNTC